MNWISNLEKRFGSWAIPHLALYLIGAQVVGVILLMGGYIDQVDLVLHGRSVMQGGEWWRLFSFMMIPRTMSALWLFFAFYIFYMIGNSLEEHWGTFRFNLFLLSGYLLTILTAFISPGAFVTNTYFLGCVFLAFATLFPQIEFRLFFILPVKVKWLGWLTVVIYVVTLFIGDMGSRLGVLAAFANYLIFFGKTFFLNFKAENRRKAFVAERAVASAQPMHVCTECGASDKSDPSQHFRYCSTCGNCYCEKHISQHGH
jgi:hypothetical protein